jgi:DNA-binding IclR family transcriptional regulator
VPRPSPQTERVLAAINVLAVHPDGLSLTELARTIDANTASCVHMLAAMADAGFVVRDASTKRYAVGPALIVPGQAAAARYPALGAARREAEELVRTLGVVCFVMAREGAETRLVHRSWDPRHVPPAMQLGDALPLVPPLGSVFVAWAGDQEVEAWLTRGPADARARTRARRVLAAARRHGYVVELVPSEPLLHELGRLLARTRTGGGRGSRVRSTDDTFVLEDLDLDAEYAVSSIGAPVFDADGAVHLVLSALGLPARLTGREVARIGRAVRAAADRATASSGGRVPPRTRSESRRKDGPRRTS